MSESPLEDLERLKAEYAKERALAVSPCAQRAAWSLFHASLVRHADYLLSAAREAETLREDAERYRWLRDGERNLWVTSGIEEHGTEGCDDHEVLVNRFTGQCLDAAVDAAARNSTKGI